MTPGDQTYEAQKHLREMYEASLDGRAAPLRQGPVQEDSEVQRLRLEVAQLRGRIDVMEAALSRGPAKIDMDRARAEMGQQGYRGFVDMMSEEG